MVCPSSWNSPTWSFSPLCPAQPHAVSTHLAFSPLHIRTSHFRTVIRWTKNPSDNPFECCHFYNASTAGVIWICWHPKRGKPAFNLNNDGDILWKAGTANCSFLILLDLRTAFDTVDHPIYILMLRALGGITCHVLDWFTSQHSNWNFGFKDENFIFFRYFFVKNKNSWWHILLNHLLQTHFNILSSSVFK